MWKARKSSRPLQPNKLFFAWHASPFKATGNSDRWSRPYRACPQALYTRGAFGGNGFFAAGSAPEWSQAECIHFGLFVAPVFPRIAQAVFEAAGLFRQCPDEALTCGQ